MQVVALQDDNKHISSYCPLPASVEAHKPSSAKKQPFGWEGDFLKSVEIIACFVY